MPGLWFRTSTSSLACCGGSSVGTAAVTPWSTLLRHGLYRPSNPCSWAALVAPFGHQEVVAVTWWLFWPEPLEACSSCSLSQSPGTPWVRWSPSPGSGPTWWARAV